MTVFLWDHNYYTDLILSFDFFFWLNVTVG